jgi:hypothetical protein
MPRLHLASGTENLKHFSQPGKRKTAQIILCPRRIFCGNFTSLISAESFLSLINATTGLAKR